MNSLERVELPADQLGGDAVAVLFFEDQRPLRGPCAVLDWRLDGALTRALFDGELTGRAGEHAVYQGTIKVRSDWILFVGGGKWDGLCTDTYASLVGHLLTIAWQAGFRDLSLCLPLPDGEGADGLFAMVGKELTKSGKHFTACRLSMVDGLTVQR